MATRTWNGAVADWNTEADWTPGSEVPQPGDTAVIASGTVILTTDQATADHRFETNAVTLGGSAGATLLLRNPQAAGRYYNVTIVGSATIEADGNRGFAGNITGNPNDGSTITLKGDPGGNLVLLNGGSFNVTDRTVDFEGNVTLERNANISGNIVNNGTISILSGKTDFATNGLSGTGTISIGGNASFSVEGFQFSGANQTISFAGTGGTLDLSYQSTGFAGTVKDFAPGDFISFLGVDGSATTASLDTSAHTLTIASASQNYVFHNVYGQAGALSDVRQSNGYDLIGYASAAPQLNYQIDAGSRAMHADVAQGMTVPETATPITGAGVKVGIISDSFNIKGGASADVTNGYLPAAGVTVLREGPAGAEDEGRAMAELIHQGAPGASLYFASTGSGVDDFATSVQALQAAGCTVIVDDIGFTGSEPFFQLGSPAENAISGAITAGVTYVSSAGNYGNAVYQHAFTTSQQTLADGSSAKAMTFSNGTPYQSITANGGLFDTIDLQWDAPFYGTGGVATDQPGSIAFKLFDPSNNNALVGTSTQVSQNGHLVAESELAIPFSSSTKTYNLAIYQTDGTPVPGQVKYIISGSNKGSSVGGRINDPDAGVGSGTIFGHQLIPGVIAVAAVDVTNTSALGRSPDFAEYFTSTGPGTLLFDAAGNRLAQPITAGSPDLAGPDGIQTSVSGFTPFYGTSAAAPNVAAVVALMQQVQPGISPDAVSSILAQSALPVSAEPSSVAGAGLVQADQAILLEEQLACYRTGTLILTERGERPVEELAVGDHVVTASGARRPVRWIGHRDIDCAGHARPWEVHPVRILVGAFGGGLPERDLFLSPGHPVLVGEGADEVLVPIMCLINGTSVARAPVEEVTYWHVELERHDILLAEGLPAESFLDFGNRPWFENGADHALANPDFIPPGLGGRCRPVATDGPAVEAERRRLDILFELSLAAHCAWPSAAEAWMAG